MNLTQSLLIASLDGLWFGAAIWLVVRFVPGLSPRVEAWLWRLVPLKLILGFFGLGVMSWEILLPASGSGQPAGLGPAAVAWLAGAVLSAGLLAREALAVRRLRQTAGGRLPEWSDELREVSRDMRLRRMPELRASSRCSQPLVMGVIRPIILVPDSAAAADETDRRALLAHECAHIAHGDLLAAWLFAAARILFYFHPALWIASRQCAGAQERASDLAAVEQARLDRADYAAWLVKISARRQAGSTWSLAASGAFQRLHHRIAALEPRRLSSAAAGAAVIIGVFGLIASTEFVSPTPQAAPSPNLPPAQGASMPNQNDAQQFFQSATGGLPGRD